MNNPASPPAVPPPPSLPPPAHGLLWSFVCVLFVTAAVLYWSGRRVTRAEAALNIPGAPGITATWLPTPPQTNNAAGDSLPPSSIEQIVALDASGAFVPLPPPGTTPALNRRPNEQRWYRLTIDPAALPARACDPAASAPGQPPAQDGERHGVLDMVVRIYDCITLYTPAPGGGWMEQVLGSDVSPRDPRHTRRLLGFDLTVPAAEPITVYLHARDYQRLPRQFRFWPDGGDYAARERFLLTQGAAFFALWAGMMACGVFHYAMLRRRDQLHYVAFISLLGLMSWHGSAMFKFFYAWPLPWLPLEVAFGALGCVALHQLCLFVRFYVDAPGSDPAFDRVLRPMCRIPLLLLPTVAVCLWPAATLIYLRCFIMILTGICGVLLWAAARRWLAGCRQSPALLLAFTPYFLALLPLMAAAGKTDGGDDEVRFLLLVCTGLHLVLLTLATACRQRMLLGQSLLLHAEHAANLERAVEARTRELREVGDRLSAMVVGRNRVLSIIGHDLRGPAGSLQSLTRMLADESAEFTSAELAEISTEIARACMLQVELLNNLLAWSGSALASTGRPEAVADVRDAVGETWRLLEWTAGTKKLTFTQDVPAGLVVRAEASHLQTILRNLLVNSIKFTPAGGRIRVAAGLVPARDPGEEARVEIRVSDTGVGIPPARLERLLDGIVESTPGTQAEKGVGIGLNLCNELVRAIGGTIRITSTSLVGTIVFLTLRKAT
ncbi:sensor histidine kinase [Geminisphaera colitermitum]|uniref:sensor histidine kinase n=1 Tax=Geminisphaera colitermitum TaxID=1148786 RepID=UPI0009DE0120|nr:ATP-binding protein [Geminisphaera colitermitum]